MAILAYRFPVFQPSMRIIASITNAYPAVVTTTFAHNYVTGTVVRLDIPLGYGMQEANQQFGTILVIDSVTFSIPIDTSMLSVFSAPAAFPLNYQYAQCVPIGEDNSILVAAVQNVLPYKAT